MKKTLYLFLFALMSACASAATVVPPHNTLEWTNPTLNADGSPLTDLVSVTFTCGGVPFTVPTTTPGASLSEPLPAGVLALTGAVSCTGIATSTSGGDSVIPSNNSDRWCDGTACYDTQPAYCAGGTCYDAVPPDPPTLGDGGGQTGGGASALAVAAAGLSPGQSAVLTPNVLQFDHDVQWQTRTIYFDAARQEVQYLGKPASTQTNGSIYSHYTYDLAADTWSVIRPVSEGLGHAWTVTFDPDTGDYYYHMYGSTYLLRYDRAAGAWIQTAPQASPSLVSGGSGVAALGFHPNLYGPGRPGVVAWAIFNMFAYDPATDTWSRLTNPGFASGTPYFNRAIGEAVYLPATDQLIMFAKNQGSGDNAILVDAGAGLSTDVIGQGYTHVTSAPPIEVYGAGTTINHGHVTEHPDDPNILVLLDEKGTSRVWYSTDFGTTWQLQSFTHPFQTMPGLDAGEYTVGTIAEHGVIAGIVSNGSGGEFRIWKPGA